MRANKLSKKLFILILLISIVGCDQISKGIVRQKLDYNKQSSLAGNFITITKVENTGAFLSLGDHLPRSIYIILMIILPLIVIGYALFYLLISNKLSGPLVFGFCFIIAGGLGNIIDRILYGSVTDFLHFNFGLFHTGIVNVADISVTAGFIILIYYFFLNRKKSDLKPT